MRLKFIYLHSYLLETKLKVNFTGINLSLKNNESINNKMCELVKKTCLTVSTEGSKCTPKTALYAEYCTVRKTIISPYSRLDASPVNKTINEKL